MYKVLEAEKTSALELQKWLNLCLIGGYKLIAVDHDYYIFDAIEKPVCKEDQELYRVNCQENVS